MADRTRLEAFIVEAKRLRSIAAGCTADFFVYLMQAEADESLWRGDQKFGTGYATFAELLSKNALSSWQTLDRFKRMVDRFGIERVRHIGVDVCERLMPIPEDAPSKVEPCRRAIDTALEEAEQFVERNGTIPSKRSGDSFLRKHFDPPHKPKKESVELLALREKVAQLTAENVQLRRMLGLPPTGPIEWCGAASGAGGARKKKNRSESARMRARA